MVGCDSHQLRVYTVLLLGNLFIVRDGNGVIMGNSEEVWEKPLGLERTVLNKMSMLGSFETDMYEIETFELNSLPIFGENCWEDKGTD